MNRHLVLATILAAMLAVGASGQRCLNKEEELGVKIIFGLCVLFGAAILVLIVIVVCLGCCLCRLSGKDSGRTSGRNWAMLDIAKKDPNPGYHSTGLPTYSDTA